VPYSGAPMVGGCENGERRSGGVSSFAFETNSTEFCVECGRCLNTGLKAEIFGGGKPEAGPFGSTAVLAGRIRAPVRSLLNPHARTRIRHIGHLEASRFGMPSGNARTAAPR